ncbi:MAG TPA: hypothetical protein VNL37_06515 [Candidatus Polarisedimenticolia bacterium]|nr:hypothetical protein [Candidatus Polarisedimenticolia bacterium]
MMKRTGAGLGLGLLLAAAAATLAAADGPLAIRYLYNLSDFTGVVPYNDVRLYADRAHDEVYAATGNAVRVFNGAGMEVYHFDGDPALGTIFDLAVDAQGDLLLLTLSLGPGRTGPGWLVAHCDYRGVLKDRIVPHGLPPELASFRPNVMTLREGRLLLASLADLRAVEIDRSGAFHAAYDLARLAGLKDETRRNNEMFGFSVDRRGRMLFTIPTLFRAFVVDPDGTVRTFGRGGSAPGAFSVASGIVGDDAGHLFIADKGRGVVLVFDDRLEFVTEFGAAAPERGGLVRPTDLALGDAGKLYVTQARDRGVAVFQVGEPPETAAP